MLIAYFAPVFLNIPLENSFNRLQLLLNKKQMLIPPLSSMRKLAPVVVPGSRCQWCRSLVPAVTRPGSTLLWRPTPPPPPPPPLIPPRCPVELPSPLPSTYALEGFNRELSTPQK